MNNTVNKLYLSDAWNIVSYSDIIWYAFKLYIGLFVFLLIFKISLYTLVKVLYLEEEMAIHSSILAWKIPMDRKA